MSGHKGSQSVNNLLHIFIVYPAVITPQGSFWLYSGVGALTWLFAYTQLPELMGVSINDVEAALEGSMNAREPQQSNTEGYQPVRTQDDDVEEEAGK